jgi:hypothetical protein
MGFLRKALWVGTGGASGVVVRANSKKARTANLDYSRDSGMSLPVSA